LQSKESIWIFISTGFVDLGETVLTTTQAVFGNAGLGLRCCRSVLADGMLQWKSVDGWANGLPPFLGVRCDVDLDE
jgi:hypothetical protein